MCVQGKMEVGKSVDVRRVMVVTTGCCEGWVVANKGTS